ncbi:hypothetical protein F4805DRAFT_328711 [Annulohypoxylon moriforme]|nr:hypothetical protein F4805DRAFT_328711 [Annulohypoxylon moriforme]
MFLPYRMKRLNYTQSRALVPSSVEKSEEMLFAPQRNIADIPAQDIIPYLANRTNRTNSPDQPPTKPQHFHLFKMLPPEIRIKIWNMAAGSKLKEIFELQPLGSENPLPPAGKLAVFKVKMDRSRIGVARTCYESWEIIQGLSKVSDWPLTPMRTRMDPNLDSLMIHADVDLKKFWMTPEKVIGDARHLIFIIDELWTLPILDDIPASSIKNGSVSSVETISIIFETFILPSSATAQVHQQFSAQIPFVIDIEDTTQIDRVATIIDNALEQNSGFKSEISTRAGFYEAYDRLANPTHDFCERIRERIRANIDTTDDVTQDHKIPDIKRVYLFLDESDKMFHAQKLDKY